MSKELATICTDCPIEFSYEEAKIDNLYTPEVYQLMKRLEFKSILSRFSQEAMGHSRLEDGFVFTSDQEAAEKWLKEAKSILAEKEDHRHCIGMQLIAGGKKGEDREVKGLSLSLDEERTVCILTGRISGCLLYTSRCV